MLGIEGEYPATHSENIFWQNCKKSTVKHSLGKFILFNLVNLAKIFFPRLSITFILWSNSNFFSFYANRKLKFWALSIFKENSNIRKTVRKHFNAMTSLNQEKSSLKNGIVHYWGHVRYQYSVFGQEQYFNIQVRQFRQNILCLCENLEAIGWRVFAIR